MSKIYHSLVPTSDDKRIVLANSVLNRLNYQRDILLKTSSEDKTLYIKKAHFHNMMGVCAYCLLHQPSIDIISSEILYSLMTYCDINVEEYFTEENSITTNKTSPLKKIPINDLSLQSVYGVFYPEMLITVYKINKEINSSSSHQKSEFCKKLLDMTSTIQKSGNLQKISFHESRHIIERLANIILGDLGKKGGLKTENRRKLELGMTWLVIAHMSQGVYSTTPSFNHLPAVFTSHSKKELAVNY